MLITDGTRASAKARRGRPWATVAVALLLLSGCSSPTGGVDTWAGTALTHTGPTWTQVTDGPLSARRESAGAWLDQHFVLVGGWSGAPCPLYADCAPVEPALRDGARLDPSTGTWTPIADAPVPVSGDNTVVVGDKLYLLTADVSQEIPPAFLAYDPASDTWMSLPAPPSPASTLVAAGKRVLAVARTDELQDAADYVYAPATGTWQQLPEDPLGRSFDREAVWLGDRLMLTARKLVPSPGSEEPALVRMATLDATLAEWTLLEDSEVIGGNPHAVPGRVVFPSTGSADGGEVDNWGRFYPNGGILNLHDTTWSALPLLPSGPGLGGHTLTVGDSILVGGHLLDPATGNWTVVPPPPWQERRDSASLANTDTILVWGGSSGEDNLADGYLIRF